MSQLIFFKIKRFGDSRNPAAPTIAARTLDFNGPVNNHAGAFHRLPLQVYHHNVRLAKSNGSPDPEKKWLQSQPHIITLDDAPELRNKGAGFLMVGQYEEALQLLWRWNRMVPWRRGPNRLGQTTGGVDCTTNKRCSLHRSNGGSRLHYEQEVQSTPV